LGHITLVAALCTGCGGGSTNNNNNNDRASAPAPAPVRANQFAVRVPGAQGTVLALYQALYGKAPAYATLQTLTAQANANPAGFVASFVGSFGYLDDAALARLVLANLNLSAATVGQANLDSLQALLPQLFAAYSPSARGAIIVNLANLLSDLEADSNYGVAAAAFNNQLLANQTYASNSANTADAAVTPPVPSVTLTFDAQPTAVTRTVGTSVAFTAHVNGAQSYQWFRSGVAIAGATTDTLKLSAVAFGDDGAGYAVEAKSSSGASMTSQTAVLTVNAAGAPIAVGGCRAITTPGSYVLTADLVPSSNASECIAIHDTSSVQLDCAGHTLALGPTTYIAPLVLTNVRDFSVKNCKLKSDLLSSTNVSDGVFSGNTWSHPDPSRGIIYWGLHATRVVYDNNTITGTLQLQSADTVSITNNALGGTTMPLAGVLIFNAAKHTRVIGNTLDGGWDGQQSTGITGDHNKAAADDGIILTDADDAIIANNLIKNVWDTGIETLGMITNSVVRDNRIVRASFSGIGGWYWNSLLGNTFARNTVELSGPSFYFARTYGLRAANSYLEGVGADTAVYFKDNTFDGNVTLNPVSYSDGVQPASMFNVLDPTISVGSVSSLPGEVPLKASDFIISNNLFKNNNFGKLSSAPTFGFFNPPLPGYVVDGGGNICSQPLGGGLGNPQSYYPIVCH
jgi:hypothetical protein